MHHRLRGPQTGVLNPHITCDLFPLGDSSNPPPLLTDTNTQHSRNCGLVYASWCNCRFAESLFRVITCHPFLIPVLDRGIKEMHGQVSPSLWTPRASSFGCSVSHVLSPSSLSLQSEGPMHTHTHTVMQHKHTHVRERDTNANREHVAVHEERLVHTKYRDFHISYRKIYILIFKCELYQSSNSMKEH